MKKLLRKVYTFYSILVSWLIFFLSFCIPKDKKTWVFIGWHKNQERETFADNSKYLFLNVSNFHKDINSIWISSDKKISEILSKEGYKSHSIYSIKGIWYSLRAKYTVTDSVMKLKNWRYAGGSRVIQLWHADGIKKLNFTNKWRLKEIKKILLTPHIFQKFYFFIASSKYIANNFITPSFNVGNKKIHVTGLPRYDVFFNEIRGQHIDANTSLGDQLSRTRLLKPEKILLYAPTFRRKEEADSPLDNLKLPLLNKILKEKNYFMFISLHPKFSVLQWEPSEVFSNILFTNGDLDTYPFLPQFDLLITDYSSICLEFLLLDKPVIFYVYDFETYKKNPGIQENFWNLIPGPRTKNFEELSSEIKNNNADILSKERQKARDMLFTFENKGESSENVTQMILKDINE